ncbi:MAG: HD domain-containing phosphohydrolase [Actinomycetales bacterium]
MSPTEPSLRLGELVATFALAQDNAFGQPLESQLRSCLLADWMCREAGFDPGLRETTYWVALLRYLGCTGHAHEVAELFHDDLSIRAQTLVHDAADRDEVLRDAIQFATAVRPPEQHEEITAVIRRDVDHWLAFNFSSGCEVADMLAARLGFDDHIRGVLGFSFERWNGAGFPHHASGEEIPLAMRIVHVSHDMEAYGRRFSAEEALQVVRDRSGRTYDPELAELFATHGAEWFDRLAALDPWDAVLALEPEPHRTFDGARLDEMLLVVADFVDLKSPFMSGHSRRCADLASAAAKVLGYDDDAIASLRRAALVHELGTTAVPNSIWDKAAPLTRAEFDRVELHPMVTEQMLRRSGALRLLNPLAAAHHERPDGSGYHKSLAASALEPAAQVLTATDVYVGLTSDRADRPALSADDAAAELLTLAARGSLDPTATGAVLEAAGHSAGVTAAARRAQPGGLTEREAEVLRLAARGLTTKAIAEQLFISPKTADHHIQHVYTKIGVSTRAAAALWAMQQALVA